MIRATCSSCRAQFALGLLCCPHCHQVSPQYAANVKKEVAMPRITVADGPSNAGAAPGEVGYIVLQGEHGPEPDALPKGAYMVGEEGFEGASDLTVLHEAPEAGAVPGRLALHDYESMTLIQLRQAAKDQGLPSSGAKADLLSRLGRGGVAVQDEAGTAAIEQEVSA